MKDYKKILEGVVDIINTTEKSDIGFANICAYIGENCPELKESEDERIRKQTLEVLNYYKDEEKSEGRMPTEIEECIAWLEKQVEQKPDTDFSDLRTWKYIVDAVLTEKEGIGQYLDSPFTEEVAKKLQKRFGNIEKRPADKVESKFKVGDWVVYDHRLYQVVELPKKGYINLGLKGNGKVVYAPSTYCRLWTIQDAKDGDVLADGNLPFIFKKTDSMMHSYAYCGISVDDGFKIESEGESGEWTWMQDIKPATKEQRDQLEKAMVDAGYTFDFERKELKKIEQNPAWSEYDEEFLLELSQCCDLNKTQVQWLLSLKDRVQPQPKQEWSEEDERIKDAIYDYIYSDTHILYVDSQAPKGWLNSLKDRIQQKYEWSEEDESHIRYLIECLEHCKKGVSLTMTAPTAQEYIDWLKFLRPRSQWKPSGEQMKALDIAIRCGIQLGSWEEEALKSLKEELKKLKG